MLVAGCPQQRATSEQTATTPTASSSTPATAGADSASEQPATEPEQAEPSEPATQENTNAAVDVVGTWLALFGRGDQGVNEQALTNGHRLQFNPDGTLLLTMIENGQPGQQLAGTYRIEEDRLEWSYSLVAAMDTGAIDVAPLGMGRDEEIGLLNKEKEGMGRDEEIGLLKGEKEGMGRDVEIGLTGEANKGGKGEKLHTEDLRVVMDGLFMALTDDHGQIYVYGNQSAALDQPLPKHEWSGTVEGKVITVEFAETGDQVTGQLGDYGGTFSGQLVDGFIAGRIEGQPRLSLAALAMADDGTLNGVLLTDPYAKMDPQFDFSPLP